VNQSNPEDVTKQYDQGKTASHDSGQAVSLPRQVGRYRIERLLGRGGFGRVYLARDEELDRYVAVKIPHAHLVKRPEDAKAYLTEARTVANLDHPNIVPVHDVGSTPDYPCYVVSKYVEGSDLSTKLQSGRLNYLEAAELVATLAAALHYAHKQGIVHRDVKPGNILIGTDGKPYVVDFGLALREEDIGKGSKQAGTAAYMSPEQARGEGHRVDGRSDVFSLGVVLYQLLVGRLPFRGDTQAELLEQVVSFEPRPLRQYDEKLPKELERICNRALAKRASERYTSAHDMGEDLRLFIAEQTVIHSGSFPGSVITGVTSLAPETPALGLMSTSIAPSSASSDVAASAAASESQPIKIIPKGLRSFDAHDADFFLELLPGPRDRSGLPDGVRFWKSAIEEIDPDQTFAVGLIYGQSGCGKTSLIKAALLPRLCEDVIPVYVEATPDETETRLLRGLRKRCPSLQDNLSLKDSLTSLRRGLGAPNGKKVLIVLDQFEQWLHANNHEESHLVQALRQCDGSRVQCIVMVRDDFWMATTRFMRELDLRLREGENSAAVDLFPVRHAERVLLAFGRAFGVLPEDPSKISSDQKAFIKQSAAGLAEDGKVVCVRLALFAEMMKGKIWTPATLKQVGGTKGVGAAFLEETFSVSTAPPEHRYHQRAARKVLQALLPASGANIKGEMKSYDELLKLSGYARRPRDFDDLIKILDREIRLVTPTDPDGRHDEEDASSRGEVGQKYYQLTHDYLVHSLRDWLTRKQRETRRGRAELQLNDRVAVWTTKREPRYLPSLLETINIYLRTERREWSSVQRGMMKVAARHHCFRALGVLAVLAMIGAVIAYGVSVERNRVARTLVAAGVDSLQNSRGDVVPYAISDLAELPEPMVREELRRRLPSSSARRRLTLAYALASLGDVDHRLLVSSIATAPSSECGNIAAALSLDPARSQQTLAEAIAAAEESRDWRRKARLAIVALIMGEPDHAANMLDIEHQPDPTQRTTFIDQFSVWHAKFNVIADAIQQHRDDGFISGLCLAAGRTTAEDLTQDEVNRWQSVLEKLYRQHPSPGVHSAAAWSLASWNLSLPSLAVDNTPPDSARWQVTPEGLTLIQIRGGEFSTTMPDGETEVVSIDTDYLISDREISVDLFRRFISDQMYAGEKPLDWEGESKNASPTGAHPVQQVSWHDAVMFCNWLSTRERRTVCYVPNSDSTENGDWTLIDDANGYYLPSDRQWEYACRAGSRTRFCCGDADEFLDQYAVFRREDHTEPVGSKMCNAWGLFDMHGNVWEWVGEYPLRIAEQAAQKDKRVNPSLKVLRGGSRGGTGFQLTSDWRNWHRPDVRSQALGFRVARRP
jgi:serine/threonine protein kinase/formylglycine-generating enzyme required for sulfatase activity